MHTKKLKKLFSYFTSKILIVTDLDDCLDCLLNSFDFILCRGHHNWQFRNVNAFVQFQNLNIYFIVYIKTGFYTYFLR